MEDRVEERVENRTEDTAGYTEEKPSEDKKKFWHGTLCGALVMLVVCVIVGGTLIMFDLIGRQGSTPLKKTEGIVDAETQERLEEIWRLIEANYLYYDDIDKDALMEAIIKGYVNGLNEPYSVYYNRAETQALFESTTGEFGGIGVVITKDLTTGLLTFTNVYEDAPGKAAGFQAGDLLYKVDGEDITGLDMDTVVSKIRGEVGTTVTITVLRGESREEYTGVATRALIQNDTVYHEMKAGKIGYIQVTGFEDVTYKQFEAALTDLNAQGMKGCIIDLRNNPGGNLSTVCEMADLILPEGTVVSIRDRNGNGQVFRSDANTILNVPLVVLVNGYSASASEIFAGAVQDFGIGKIVGTTTYGKGIVQNVYRLKDGTALKITSSEYFTPNGRNIHGIGIKPDVEVEYVQNTANPSADNQLDKAIEILKSGM